MLCLPVGRQPKLWQHQPFRRNCKKAVRWKLTQDCHSFDQLLTQSDSRLFSQSIHVDHCLHHVYTHNYRSSRPPLKYADILFSSLIQVWSYTQIFYYASTVWVLVTVFLWPPYKIRQTIIFSSCGFFFFFVFFLAYSQPSQIGCLPCFHMWCGLSANLECRSEMCCTLLTEKKDAKISKNSPSAHHRTTLTGCRTIFATKACIAHVKQQYFFHTSSL